MSNWNNQTAGGGANLDAALAGRSWNWLEALCRALNVSVQLVDQRLATVLPADSSEPDELQKLTIARAQPLQSVLSAALQSRHAQFAAVGSLHVVCTPLLKDNMIAGGLVIGRAAPLTAHPADGARAKLERVASWLASAVEGHLTSYAAPAGNLLPLIRVFEGTVEQGSDRELVRVFAEALAVWHDIEVVGYIETSPGAFAREVSLGRPQSTQSLVLPPAAVPPALQLTRMPRADIEGPGPVTTHDVIVTTLSRRDSGGTWLLVLSGSLDACETQLLANYVAVLDISVARAVEASKAAVTAGLSRRLSSDDESEAATASLLDELRNRLGVTSVVLTLESHRGSAVLRAASPPHASVPPDTPSTHKVTVVRQQAGQPAVTLVLARAKGPQFTPLEHQVVQAAAVLLEAWALRAALGRVDRGAGFGEQIEHLAKEALERGTVVTAVVMSATQPSGSRATEKWVEEIRRRMRQSDTVGMLPAGEIGLLLQDTTAAHAKAVTRRLESALGAVADPEFAAITTIGFATRMPGQDAADGIVQDARMNATQRSNGDSHTGIM